MLFLKNTLEGAVINVDSDFEIKDKKAEDCFFGFVSRHLWLP